MLHIRLLAELRVPVKVFLEPRSIRYKEEKGMLLFFLSEDTSRQNTLLASNKSIAGRLDSVLDFGSALPTGKQTFVFFFKSFCTCHPCHSTRQEGWCYPDSKQCFRYSTHPATKTVKHHLRLGCSRATKLESFQLGLILPTFCGHPFERL